MAKKKLKKQESFIKIHRSQLDESLSYMKSLALSMGGCVEETLNEAKDIFLGKISLKESLSAIKEREEEINIFQLKLSKACFRSIARQAPVAKDLRMILTVLNASTDLERMGDLAINIVHRIKKMQDDPSLKDNHLLLEKMFNSTIEVVNLTLDAFVKESVEMSKKVLEMDSVVDSCQKKIGEELKKTMKSNTDLISTCVDSIIVSGHLERIADHSTNIAEEIIFLQTGLDIRHGN